VGRTGSGLGFEENELLCVLCERMGLPDGMLAEWIG
jgi:hypothetical protein